MTVIKRLSMPIFGAALITLSVGETVQAALMVNSESALVNLDTQSVLFTINFNEVPDFFSVDTFGRQADSFQYFIEADGEFPIFRGSPYYSELETIIRGEEIHIAGDIRVRNIFPNGIAQPNSGGWGSIRGSVPYTLNDTTLNFSVPLQLIGDDDGLFSYRLEWYEFGAIQDFKDNKSVFAPPQPVPEPMSISSTVIAAVMGWWMRRKHKNFLPIKFNSF